MAIRKLLVDLPGELVLHTMASTAVPQVRSDGLALTANTDLSSCRVLLVEILVISKLLIGQTPTLLRSHWSRASKCWNIFLVLLTPALLCHKEPSRSKQNTAYRGRGLWMRRGIGPIIDTLWISDLISGHECSTLNGTNTILFLAWAALQTVARNFAMLNKDLDWLELLQDWQ